MRKHHALVVKFLILFTFCISNYSYADTLNVPDDYPTIQDAIDASVNGDTVQVAPGTYLERIDFSGKLITVTSREGSEQTTIKGDRSGPVVIFENNESRSAIFSGFSISGIGSSGDTFNPRGGGISVINASPTIKDNLIQDILPAGGVNRQNVLTTLNSSALIENL